MASESCQWNGHWTGSRWAVSITLVLILCFMECHHGLAMSKVSVCLTVTRVYCDKTEETSVQIIIPYKRSFSLVFWEDKWLVEATPYTWNFGLVGPHLSEITNFEPIFAHSTSAVTPSEKSSVNISRKSTKRFPMSLRWSLYVASRPPPKDG